MIEKTGIKEKRKGNYKGRPKGVKNKLTNDVTSILRLNSAAIIQKAIDCVYDKPEKFQVIFGKLLDKIAPSLSISTNINVSEQFETKLIEVLGRANNLKAVEVANIELLPEPKEPENVSHLLNKEMNNTEKTAIYIDSVQEINTNTKKELSNEQSDNEKKAGEN